MLRVIDFGQASPLRSQTLWHAIAYGVSEGAPPTLSFVRPSGPYVSIGRTRDPREVDLSYCRRAGLPVYRRMVGGGPVYLDPDQLFFQITLPQHKLPPARAEALRFLLAPAVQAFRSQGVPASLDAHGEIVLGDRKICGHAAGQIDTAVVVVGNLIQRFDHHRAARVLQVPHPRMRTEILRLMRRYVAATPIDADGFKEALARAYAEALGLRPQTDVLSDSEQARLRELDRLFESNEWLWDVDRAIHHVGQVKVRGGVWVCGVHAGLAFLVATAVHGRLESIRSVPSRHSAGIPAALQRSLRGLPLEKAGLQLEASGTAGRCLASALTSVAGRAS